MQPKITKIMTAWIFLTKTNKMRGVYWISVVGPGTLASVVGFFFFFERNWQPLSVQIHAVHE